MLRLNEVKWERERDRDGDIERKINESNAESIYRECISKLNDVAGAVRVQKGFVFGEKGDLAQQCLGNAGKCCANGKAIKIVLVPRPPRGCSLIDPFDG